MNEWIKQANIKGPPGVEGPPGPGISFKGTVPTYDDLPTDAEPGDMWNTDDTGHSYTWNGEEWVDGGSSRGADGLPGPPNALAIGTVTTGAPGSEADAEITGTPPSQTLNLTIPRGDSGAPGVATVSGTAPSSPVQGQLWWNPTTKTLSVRNGSAWDVVEATWG